MANPNPDTLSHKVFCETQYVHIGCTYEELVHRNVGTSNAPFIHSLHVYSCISVQLCHIPYIDAYVMVLN